MCIRDSYKGFDDPSDFEREIGLLTKVDPPEGPGSPARPGHV